MRQKQVASTVYKVLLRRIWYFGHSYRTDEPRAAKFNMVIGRYITKLHIYKYYIYVYISTDEASMMPL